MFVIPAIFPGQGRTNQSKTTQVAQFYHKTIVIDHYNIIIYYSFNLLLFPHLSLFNKWGMFFVAATGHVVCLKSSNDRDEFLRKQRPKRISYVYPFFISQSTVYLQFYMKTECRRRFPIPRRLHFDKVRTRLSAAAMLDSESWLILCLLHFKPGRRRRILCKDTFQVTYIKYFG